MTAAEQSAKENVEPAKGCVRAVGPDGETPIWTKAPRGPGPWWRVKHVQYGSRTVRAANEDEAIQKFFAEFVPGLASDLEWCKEHMRLNGGRVARLPGGEPAAEAKPVPATPERAKK
jgi:hypothetical protein